MTASYLTEALRACRLPISVVVTEKPVHPLMRAKRPELDDWIFTVDDRTAYCPVNCREARNAKEYYIWRRDRLMKETDNA